MLKLKKIAITGGLAAGKTTVCQFFRELGAFVISADEIVHQLLSPLTQVGQQVIRLLGSDILHGAQIDRKRVSEKVFPYPEKLRALEQIIHPAVFDEIEKKYQQIEKEKKHQLFIAEIPLLYESKNEGQFDAIISVISDPVLCQERFIHIQQHTELDFTQRMSRQLEPEKKAHRSDYVLYNNGTVEELRAQVAALFSILTRTN
jgi:dephospho-CoA kinase